MGRNLDMVELILVRHGETDSNSKGAYCGWTDVGLNEQGEKQAKNARDKLKDEKIDGVFSSPLKRAFRTAEIINENFGLEIKRVDALKERNFGVWEDLKYKEICEKHPEEVKLWEADWVNYCIKGGESAVQAFNRVNGFVGTLIESNKGAKLTKLLIVTHLGCIRSIVANLLGMGNEGCWRFKVDNAGITRLVVNDEGYAYLTMLNG